MKDIEMKYREILRLHDSCNTYKVISGKNDGGMSGGNKRYESVLEEIFGSCIYAIVLFSESRKTFDLDKVLLMLLLNQFDMPKDVYSYNNILGNFEKMRKEDACIWCDWSSFENGARFAMILNEYYNQQSLDSKVAHMCEAFEQSYTNGFEPTNPDNGYLFYKRMMKLKELVRTGWKQWNVKSDRLESVAEHTVAATILSIAMQSEFYPNVDLDNLVLTMLLHEVGETEIGDITPYQGISREEKEKRELEAVRKILKPLRRGTEYTALMVEFMHSNGVDYMSDKAECDLMAFTYDDGSYDLPLENAVSELQSNPKLCMLHENGARSMRDYFYEVDIEKYDSVFKNLVDMAYEY